MPTVISLFSGAGGLDYGLEAAGFTFGAGVELNEDCVATLRASRPAWQVLARDLSGVSIPDLLRLAKVKAGQADLLAGGPPCQPFSKASHWARGDTPRLSDPRADTLNAYMQVVKEALPKVFLIENVHGLLYAGKDEGFRLLLRRIDQINRKHGTSYTAAWQVLNAADYGVPQLRERIFIVAHRDGRTFRFPSPTHQPASSDHTRKRLRTDLYHEPYRTAWDAIGDVRVTPEEAESLALRGKWAGLLPSIPEGCNYLHHTDRGKGLSLFGWRTRYWPFLLKLAKGRPSWTIQAQPGPSIGPFHWSNRRLSVRELCRLQTFPDDVVIVGDLTSAQRQLGNAVPSLLGEVIGRAIREQLLDEKVSNDTLTLLPVRREATPRREPVARVAKRFRAFEGEHPPHPGTGRGKGALARQRGEREAAAR